MNTLADIKVSKFAIAMSGGVDSSVAAALVAEKCGIENVFGVTMKLFCYGENEGAEKSCCSLDAISDAAAVCKQIGIPHYVVNLEKEFQAEIIDNFVTEYAHGQTPNPCIRCNSLIKFQHLLRRVGELGADVLVTGHYARVNHDKEGYHLLTGLDKTKDQSYFLYNLDQDQLEHIWFPLGELTKSETRKLAEKYALKTAHKAESQDICFVPNTTKDFLLDRVKAKPGNIVNKEGKTLGKHEGLPFYTVGQRKGLGGGFADPMYVTRTDLVKNEVVVGAKEDLLSDALIVDDFHWLAEAPELPLRAKAKIRYNSPAVECTISRCHSEFTKEPVLDSSCDQNDNMCIKFTSPQTAITPGQTAVFYSGAEVLGGGIIEVPVNPVP